MSPGRALLGGGALALAATGCAPAPASCRSAPAQLGPATGPLAPGPTTLTVETRGDRSRLWVDGGATPGWVAVPPSGAVPVTLAPDTVHTALLEQCGEVQERWTLTTTGAPASATVPPLAATSWAADLLDPEARFHSFTTPPSAAALGELVGEATGMLIGVDATGTAWLGFAEVTADRAWQHSCVAPDALPLSRTGDALQLGPATLRLAEPPDRQYDLEGVEITATLRLADDGTVWADELRLRMDIDLRTLPGGNGVNACAQLAALGATCQPCADQRATGDTDDTGDAGDTGDARDTGDAGAPACLPLDVSWPALGAVPGLVVDPLLAPEPQC